MTAEEDAIIAEETERIRRMLSSLGVEPEPGRGLPEALGLPSGAEFVARMKARDRRRRRGRIAGLALAAAVAIVAGTLVVLRPWAPDASAAATPPVLDYEFSAATRIAYAPGENPVPYLNQLASVAQKAKLDQGSGDIQLVVSNDWYQQINDTTDSSVVMPKLRRSWLLPSGESVVSETDGKPLRSDGRGVATKVADAIPRGTSVARGKAGDFPAAFVRNLPTDPAALADALLNHAGCSTRALGYTRSMCLYDQITDLYNIYVVPPRLNAALWRMLAGEKGFTALGSVTDRAGRPGFGLSIIDPRRPQYRQVLIISIPTGAILGDEVILIRDDPKLSLKAPAMFDFTTVTASKWVSSAP